MSRIFTGATTKYMTVSSVPVNDEPLTMSIWVYPTNLTLDWSGYFTLTNSSRSQYYCLRTNSYFDYRAVFYAVGSTTGAYALHGTLMSTNSWQHLAGVSAAAGDHRVYYNGSSSSVNYNNIGTCTPTITDIGVGAFSGSRTRYARAWLAEAAVWNVALSATDIQRLYSDRASPFYVRPDALVAYWPIYGRQSPEPDLVGGYSITVNGAPAYAVQPRIHRPLPSMRALELISATTKSDSIYSDAVIERLRTGSLTADSEFIDDFQPRPGVAMPGGGVFMV